MSNFPREKYIIYCDRIEDGQVAGVACALPCEFITEILHLFLKHRKYLSVGQIHFVPADEASIDICLAIPLDVQSQRWERYISDEEERLHPWIDGYQQFEAKALAHPMVFAKEIADKSKAIAFLNDCKSWLIMDIDEKKKIRIEAERLQELLEKEAHTPPVAVVELPPPPAEIPAEQPAISPPTTHSLAHAEDYCLYLVCNSKTGSGSDKCGTFFIGEMTADQAKEFKKQMLRDTALMTALKIHVKGLRDAMVMQCDVQTMESMPPAIQCNLEAVENMPLGDMLENQRQTICQNATAPKNPLPATPAATPGMDAFIVETEYAEVRPVFAKAPKDTVQDKMLEQLKIIAKNGGRTADCAERIDANTARNADNTGIIAETLPTTIAEVRQLNEAQLRTFLEAYQTQHGLDERRRFMRNALNMVYGAIWIWENPPDGIQQLNSMGREEREECFRPLRTSVSRAESKLREAVGVKVGQK